MLLNTVGRDLENLRETILLSLEDCKSLKLYCAVQIKVILFSILFIRQVNCELVNLSIYDSVKLS